MVSVNTLVNLCKHQSTATDPDPTLSTYLMVAVNPLVDLPSVIIQLRGVISLLQGKGTSLCWHVNILLGWVRTVTSANTKLLLLILPSYFSDANITFKFCLSFLSFSFFLNFIKKTSYGPILMIITNKNLDLNASVTQFTNEIRKTFLMNVKIGIFYN